MFQRILREGSAQLSARYSPAAGHERETLNRSGYAAPACVAMTPDRDAHAPMARTGGSMPYSARAASLLLTIAVATFASRTDAQVPTTSKGDVAHMDPIKANELRVGMRKLWVSNAIWMREYIVNTIGGDMSLDAASKRLA